MTGECLFSFNMGTHSIGWTVFQLDAAHNPCRILDAGVRVFPDGREPKTGASLAERRRIARAQSRRRDRYLRRRKAVLRSLVEFGLMPQDDEARKRLIGETNDQGADQRASDVYSLRARALDEALTPFQIGRVLFHLNQRRGFKSNRKTDRLDNEVGKIAIGISRLQSAMEAEGARSLGEYLAWRRSRREWVRVRMDAALAAEEDAAEDGERQVSAFDFYPARFLLEAEFNLIWDTQSRFHPHILTQARRDHLFRVMFYQRPLKAARVGRCSFNPDEFRLAKAHPLFQLFRLYKEVNELTLVNERQEKSKLTLQQRDLLIETLGSQGEMSHARLRRRLKLAQGWRFDKEEEARLKMKGNEVGAELGAPTRFGPLWAKMSIDQQWTVVEKLRETEDPLILLEWLQSDCRLTPDQAASVMDVHLPEGFGRFGRTALEAMLAQLKADVIDEEEAARRAGYDHAPMGGGHAHAELPRYQEVVARRIPPGSGEVDDPYDVRQGRISNPTIHIALNQLRRVTNRLISYHGKPARIAIELARELKLGEQAKRRRNVEMARSIRDAEQRSRTLRELGQADNGHNRLLLKLWEELNPEQVEERLCLYTGQKISVSMLFSGEAYIDHILPWSRTLDDSKANRILCLARAKSEKADLAPADVPQWQSRYDEILERAASLPQYKRWRFARDAMERFEREQDFIGRQLSDTHYLSRLVHEYLGSLFEGEEPDEWGRFDPENRVCVVPGRLTAMLRRAWGLNDLLPDSAYGDTGKLRHRKDHRHDAIDAAVAGVTSSKLLQNIAVSASNSEAENPLDVRRDIEPPFAAFRDELKAALDRLVVSHKPDHGARPKGGARAQTAGQLHNDTAYGLTGDIDERGNAIVVRRKPLTALTQKDIPSIRDPKLRTALYAVMGGLSGKELRQALIGFRRDPGAHQQFRGIRRVRLSEPLRVIPIRDAHGRAYKGYKGDANHRFDVWELADGRLVAEVVTMFDAHQAGWSSKVMSEHHNPRKVLSLHQNDMVAFDHPRLGPTIGVVIKFTVAGQLTLAAHHEAGELKRRDATANDVDPFKYFSPSAGGLKKIRLRQIRVDETGRVFDPGPRNPGQSHEGLSG